MSENYDSPIHLAAEKGQENIVRFLIDNGADVNTIGLFGGTALSAAAEKGKNFFSQTSIHIFYLRFSYQLAPYVQLNDKPIE